MTTQTINNCLSNNFDGMAINGSGTQWPISTVDRSDRTRSPQVRAQHQAHQVHPVQVQVPMKEGHQHSSQEGLVQARPETQPKAAAATIGSFRSTWTQLSGYSRINIRGPMEEVFVPHGTKIWANWKGKHGSIVFKPGMHSSQWTDEGPSVNPLGDEGASPSPSQRKDEAFIMKASS